MTFCTLEVFRNPPKFSWAAEVYKEYRTAISKEEFTEKQVREDLLSYRNVYLRAIRLFPRYKQAIIAGADYSQYCYPTVQEYDSHLTQFAKANKHLDQQYFNEQADQVASICLWNRAEIKVPTIAGPTNDEE